MSRGASTTRRRVAATFLVALAGVGPAAARADAPPIGLVASTEHVGRVDLGFFGPPGAAVRFGETVAGRSRALARVTTDARGFAPLLRAATWRCDRQTRRFTATLDTAAGGPQKAAFEVRTPSCAQRLAVRAPRHVRRGGRVTVRIVDGWRLGDRTVRLCVSGAGVRHRCATVPLGRGAAGVTRTVTAPRSGLLRLAVGLDGSRTITRTAVGTTDPVAADVRPVLLATGDSTIEGVDSYLGERLGSAVVTRLGSRPGTGLSLDGELPWPTAAARQVQRLRPRVTVISLGANDSYPMTTAGGATVACCGPAWEAEYAARARTLMTTYTRGDGRMVWMLLPVPKGEGQAVAFAAVNRAVQAAAAGRPGIRLVDLGPELSPGGVFTPTLVRDGKPVTVRAQDGVHLSDAGASIAADAVLRTLAQTRWLQAPAGAVPAR